MQLNPLFRFEAFSDGVFAVIVTIMVLELHAPKGILWVDLLPLIPSFLIYFFSFFYVIMYWNSHRRLFEASPEPTSKVSWANGNFLFWLSLVPFVTAWAGEHPDASVPVILYSAILFIGSIVYMILSSVIVSASDKNTHSVKALQNDYRVWMSPAIYLLAIGAACISPWFAYLLFVVDIIVWAIPQRKMASINVSN